MKSLLLILLFSGFYYNSASAQDAGNRKKVIAMVLEQSRVKTNLEIHQAGIYSIRSVEPSSPQGFRSLNTIPRYCLAKGAVICRLEEYVQLHSPFKLNIGVGGE
jgi:hypothetical protein